ncbi:hypothetical protein [Roseivivax sp. CAU 1761]
MRRPASVLLASLAATPALAHGGPHMHPHGLEAPLMLGLAVAAVVALAVLYRRR